MNYEEDRKPMTLEEAILEMERRHELCGLPRFGPRLPISAGAAPRWQFRSDRSRSGMPERTLTQLWKVDVGPNRKAADAILHSRPAPADLVIITGMSGSGKQTALKAFEDLGFYAVDNLPDRVSCRSSPNSARH